MAIGELPSDLQLGQVGQQAAQMPPSLLDMAQGSFDLPTNDTPEGAAAAQEYARQLQYVADKPYLRSSDFNTQNILPGFGARYVRANKITYEPSQEAWGGWPGGGDLGRGGQPRSAGSGGSGFYMGGKPVEMPIQGDVGTQLNRLPQHLRDAYGPAVVQHIMSAGSAGRYPGAIAYAPVPPIFEPGDMFRANRDAWGRPFALGSSDMPHPTRPWP